MRPTGLRLSPGARFIHRTSWGRTRDRGNKLTPDEREDQSGRPFSSDLAKYIADFHKQITTLSTGALIFLVSIVDRIFKNPSWPFLVIATVVGLLTTIVCCICSYWLHLSNVEYGRALEARQRRLDDLLGLGMILSFLGALGSLVVFFIRNYDCC